MTAARPGDGDFTDRGFIGKKSLMRRSTEKSAHGRGREADERPPAFRGWLSTDDDEIRRREWRGRTEIDEVRALDPEHHPFGDYRVASSSGGRYVVEIRSLR